MLGTLAGGVVEWVRAPGKCQAQVLSLVQKVGQCRLRLENSSANYSRDDKESLVCLA